jgi:hypothetical protein
MFVIFFLPLAEFGNNLWSLSYPVKHMIPCAIFYIGCGRVLNIGIRRAEFKSWSL